MATFSTIDADKAPPKPGTPSMLRHRMAEYEGYVLGVKKGQVGKLVPAPGESPNAVSRRVLSASKRLGKSTSAWRTEDGTVYFKVEDPGR